MSGLKIADIDPDDDWDEDFEDEVIDQNLCNKT